MPTSVKLPIKIAVKDEQEEADVLNMVELLSSPHHQPSRLAFLLMAFSLLSHPQLTLAMSQEIGNVGVVADLSLTRVWG